MSRRLRDCKVDGLRRLLNSSSFLLSFFLFAGSEFVYVSARATRVNISGLREKSMGPSCGRNNYEYISNLLIFPYDSVRRETLPVHCHLACSVASLVPALALCVSTFALPQIQSKAVLNDLVVTGIFQPPSPQRRPVSKSQSSITSTVRTSTCLGFTSTPGPERIAISSH